MKIGIFLLPMILVAVSPLPSQQPKASKVDFVRDIEPILTKNCVSCHQAAWAGGGLRLDSFEGLQHGGTSGKAVVPGNAQQSLLIARMESSDTKCMPPKERLTKDQIALVKTWITEGAKLSGQEKR